MRISRSVPIAALLVLAVGTSAYMAKPSAPAPELNPTFPIDGPADVTNQAAFDEFGWQLFVAMNWPAKEGQRGTPDLNKKIGDPGPVVWTTFKTSPEVFPENGQNPGPWNSEMAATRTMNRGGLAKLVDTRQAGTLATLTDQNKNLVRYEKAVNETYYDFVVENSYYNKDVLDKVTTNISMPNHSMETKGAWRIMTDKDDLSRFYTMEALIEGVQHTVGLVGLHLTYKTANSPQWIWATYEQADNAPDRGDSGSGRTWSFFNPECKSCPENRATRSGVPAQITRIKPIPAGSEVLNTAYHKLLEGTVWEHYNLITTQWPKDPFNPSNFSGQPTPSISANTVIESFNQGTSNCGGCHSTANINTIVKTDFTFLFSEAHSATN